jgi:hypothetical protein
MKDILADLFFGSLCYFWLSNLPVLSESTFNRLADYPIPTIERDKSTIFPDTKEFYKYATFPSVSATDVESITKSNKLKQWLPPSENAAEKIPEIDEHLLNSDRLPIWRLSEKTEYILSSRPVFWSSSHNYFYWGFREHQNLKVSKPKTTIPSHVKFNFVEKADKLSESSFLSDSSAGLVVSGGDKQKLKGDRLACVECDPNNNFNLNGFRGGIAFNQGVSKDVTFGVGFFYNQLVTGFSNLYYKPANLPLQATFSFLNHQEQGTNVKSEISFKPSAWLTLNYHSDGILQKFDLKWKPLSGFNFIVESDNKDRSLNAKADLSLGEEDLSLFARVNRKMEDRWEWEVKSNLGLLQLKHKGNPEKTNSELAFNLGNQESVPSPYSLFVSYETANQDRDYNNLTISGWRYHSQEKLGDNYRWQLDLGYGTGSQGNGLIVSGSKALSSGLSVKVSYQQVSLTSEEGNFKIEFTSKQEEGDQ